MPTSPAMSTASCSTAASSRPSTFRVPSEPKSPASATQATSWACTTTPAAPMVSCSATGDQRLHAGRHPRRRVHGGPRHQRPRRDRRVLRRRHHAPRLRLDSVVARRPRPARATAHGHAPGCEPLRRLADAEATVDRMWPWPRVAASACALPTPGLRGRGAGPRATRDAADQPQLSPSAVAPTNGGRRGTSGVSDWADRVGERTEEDSRAAPPIAAPAAVAKVEAKAMARVDRLRLLRRTRVGGEGPPE